MLKFKGGGPRVHGAGHPRLNSRATLLGMYNLDPAVRFWATPPIHGCLRETVVHPAMFTFKLPDMSVLAKGRWSNR